MSTLEHFFKPTSDAGSSSSAAVSAFAFLAAQRKTEVASAGKKRGSYATISEELKAKIAKYAAENGVNTLLRHFKSAQELDLK